MHRSLSRVASCAAIIGMGLPALAQPNWQVTGELGTELRLFAQDGLFEGQFDRLQPSIFAEIDIEYESDDRRHKVSLTPFARLDRQDEERSHIDLREAYYQYTADTWDILIGVNRIFWGVTETRHLVNVINQIDGVENIDEEDFLGQPMINIGTQQDFGRFDFFAMTGFRERTFPGEDGRLRAPLAVSDDDVIIDRGGEKWAPDLALRYSHFIGDIDIGLHIFHGTGREPILTPDAEGSRFLQTYVETTQAGVDLQYTSGATLWKFEGLVREGQGDTFPAFVAGVEHTLFQMGDSDADLGLLVEYLYDDRDAFDAPATAFDNDVFIGARYALNDLNDTALLAGVFIDTEDGTTSLRAEFERRIGESLKFETELQVFASTDSENLGSSFRRDSFLTLKLSRFF